MSDCAQDGSLAESLGILSSLLEKFASGSARITPRIRGASMGGDVRTKLEEALASVEAASDNLMVLGDL